MKSFGLSCAAIALSVFTTEAFAADGVDIKIENKSQFSIHHLYLTPTKENNWGPDQLGDKDNDTIEPGSSFTVTGIPVSKYDFQFVDEDGDKCTVAGVKVAANETVTITDADLVGCQAVTDQEANEENLEEENDN